MAEVTADRVYETSTTTGTGSYTLAGAITGYRAFSSVCANADTVRCFVEDVDANGVPNGGWEVGFYTWGTGGVLARTTVEASSNAGAAVSWAAGTRRIGLGVTASKLASLAGGLTNFTESLNTSSPNSTVNAARLLVTAPGATTDTDVVLQPKGAGAVLAQLPDGSATGGAKRGTNAVDWQTNRASSSQVASGTNATIGGGRNNTSAGINSFVGGGFGNRIDSGPTSPTISGGSSNIISGGDYATIGGGTGNATSRASSTIGGGTQNAISVGNASTIGGGDRNAITNYNATIGGGTLNKASGDTSTVVGGGFNEAAGDGSTAMGTYALARVRGAVANASGNFGLVGDAQLENLVHRALTSNATTTPLSADGSAPSAATCAILPNNSMFGFEVTVSAKVTTFGDRAVYRITGAISRGGIAAATQIDGTPTVTTVAAIGGASAWAVTATANTTLGSLSINVTGAASTSIKWVASIKLTEVVG
ncbi:hypothetical protein VLK31_07190 [Variovorax sp. H27-G14]|uniref:hypothetical protein n=1 Tax=Variovorax sp. H27-G14 TaxID=3111914 RepID=UPI0038FD12A7